MPHAPICLFTSIRPPVDAESDLYLLDCLHSWRVAGFDTVAVNGPAEADALRDLELPIEFSVMATDGKPRIGAILSAIRARGCRFAGIINSDCRIIGYPGLAANLQKGLDRTAVLAWRLDVEGTKYNAMARGFDAFFFDTNVTPRDDVGFSIGEPWWDLWFPLACEASGARIETMAIPMLTHKVHPLNWSNQDLVRSGYRFWRAFQDMHRRGTVAKSLLARIAADWLKKPTLSPSQILILTGIIPAWLHDSQPQTVAVMGPEAAEIEGIIRISGRKMLEAQELDRIREELASLRGSTSWRLTAPLRAVVGRARRFTSTWKARRKGRATDNRAAVLSP
jgi:hypothetical protein